MSKSAPLPLKYKQRAYRSWPPLTTKMLLWHDIRHAKRRAPPETTVVRIVDIRDDDVDVEWLDGSRTIEPLKNLREDVPEIVENYLQRLPRKYTVRRILRRRKHEMLVLWGDFTQTWEPVETLFADVPHLVRSFLT